MSVNAMKPTFTDRPGYLAWCEEWSAFYSILSKQIRRDKDLVIEIQMKLEHSKKWPVKMPKETREKLEAKVSGLQRELVHKRVMAHKMMTLLGEAKLRRDRILEMHKQLREQNAQFPMKIEDCRNIDFHFNKGSLEFPFLPMWALKTKGMTFYINHIDAQIPWSTRELPEGSTRGMIRLKNGDITIDAEGNATISMPQRLALKAVA